MDAIEVLNNLELCAATSEERLHTIQWRLKWRHLVGFRKNSIGPPLRLLNATTPAGDAGSVTAREEIAAVDDARADTLSDRHSRALPPQNTVTLHNLRFTFASPEDRSQAYDDAWKEEDQEIERCLRNASIWGTLCYVKVAREIHTCFRRPMAVSFIRQGVRKCPRDGAASVRTADSIYGGAS